MIVAALSKRLALCYGPVMEELGGFEHFFDIQTRHMVEAAESRLECVLQQAKFHDLIIMPAAKRHGVQKMVFGSLSDSVVQNCQKPVMVLYTPGGLDEPL